MKKILLATLSVWIMLTGSAHANQPTPLIAYGFGETEKDSLDAALIDAVESATGILISTNIIISNSELLEENIFSKSEGYVSGYKIISVTREDSGLIRTVIEATVEVAEIQSKLNDLKLITALEVNSGELYATVYSAKNKQEEGEHFLNNISYNIFKSAADFTEITVKDIYFDESDITDNIIPYVVMFEISINSSAYNGAIETFLKAMNGYGVIYKNKSLGVLGESEAIIQYKNGIYVILNEYKSKSYNENSVAITSKYGQRYEINEYKISNSFSRVFNTRFKNGIFKNISSESFVITFYSNDGTILYSDSINMTSPPEKTLAMYYYNKENVRVLEVDSSTGIKNILFSRKRLSTPHITPSIEIQINGQDASVKSVLLGYHNKINLTDISKIKSIKVKLEETELK